MPRVSGNQPVLMSVLDRLLESEGLAAKSPAQLLREFKISVQRDLEDLLNTRWRCKGWPAEMKELDNSLINYGVPDFSSANQGAAAGREEFRKVLEGVIRKFEPRLQKVKVVQVGNPESIDRTLRFRIEAILRAEPFSEPVQYETLMEPSTLRVKVQKVGQ